MAELVDTVYVPIIDLTGCQGYLEVPIELTKDQQAKLQGTMDNRIFQQLLKYYVIIPPGDFKRIKPNYLKRFQR